eukprot:974730-Rhodomonas_salina.1
MGYPPTPAAGAGAAAAGAVAWTRRSRSQCREIKCMQTASRYSVYEKCVSMRLIQQWYLLDRDQDVHFVVRTWCTMR